MEKNKQKMDILNLSDNKSIKKELKDNEKILISCPIFKFNDYAKKQQRNILVTNHAVINLKGDSVKRRIQIQNIKGISVSKIGTEFVLHIPEQYDYRYAASSDLRDYIIYFILKAHYHNCKEKLLIFNRDQLSLVHYSMTKEERKKNGPKKIQGEGVLYDDETYAQYLNVQQEQREQVRKTTKTLFAKNQKQFVTINDFTLKLVLGRGAFGTVYLVQKKDTKKLYAMKSIQKQDIVQKDQIEHTKAQKNILKHINHPFLVNLEYAFQTPSKLYFILQFMKGGQLFQHLSTLKKFSQKQAKFYVMQIALGLGHLHENQYIYRDLKLENVLMDQAGNVSLTDFGMAKFIRQGQLTNTFCGTPQYLAPQVIHNNGYDKSADWWSLGILAYQMMYGLPPFYHKHQSTMFKMIKQSQVRFPQKIPVSVQAKQFIVKMLNKNPKTRLGSNGDVNEVIAHPWLSCFNKQKILAKQVPAPYVPQTQGQKWLEGFDKQFTAQKIHEEKQQSKEDKYKTIFGDF